MLGGFFKESDEKLPSIIKQISLMKLLSILLSFLFVSLNYSQTNKDTLSNVTINCIKALHGDPITNTTLTKEKLVLGYRGNDVATVIKSTPSIVMYSDGGNDMGYMYYRIRGIDQTRINSTLNGVPLNEPEDQGAYFSNYPDFLSNVNSLQIQRGIGISSNGTSSYGGSINFESYDLTKTQSQLDLAFSSWNSKRVSYAYCSGYKNKFSVYFRLSKISSNGYRDHSGTDGFTLFSSIGYKFNKNTELKLISFVGRSVNQMAYLAADEDSILMNRKFNLLTKNENDNFTQNLTILELNKKLDKNFNLSSSIFYNKLLGQYDVLFPPINNFQLNSNYLGLIGTLKYEKNNYSSSLGILITNYNRYHSMSSYPDINKLIYKNNGIKNEIALSWKNNLKIDKSKFFTDIQLRNAKFSYQRIIDYSINVNPINWTFLNWRIGYRYSFSNNSMLYMMYGQSTKEPTRNDMFAGYDDLDKTNYFEIGNFSKVKPETSRDLELGYEKYTERLKLKIDYFNMNFSNEITPIGQLSSIGLPLRKNIDKSSRQGLELDITYKLKIFSISSNYTYMYSDINSYVNDQDGKEYKNVIPLLSPHSILNLKLSKELKDWTFNLGFRYISDSYLDNENTNKCPEFLNFDFLVKKSIFTFRIDNIFDRSNYSSGYLVNSKRNFYVYPERNYSITLNIPWN